MNKEAKAKWRLFDKVQEIVERQRAKPDASSVSHLFSKNFAKNVDAIINSRAAHPNHVRPYSDYVSLAGDKPPINRINNFRKITEAGW